MKLYKYRKTLYKWRKTLTGIKYILKKGKNLVRAEQVIAMQCNIGSNGKGGRKSHEFCDDSPPSTAIFWQTQCIAATFAGSIHKFCIGKGKEDANIPLT